MDPRVKPGDDGFFIRPSKKLDRPHIPRGRSGGRSLLNRRDRANRPLLPVGMTSQISSDSGDFAALSDALADARAALHSVRSEEHTSELQSLMRISYAVLCLKKNNN